MKTSMKSLLLAVVTASALVSGSPALAYGNNSQDWSIENIWDFLRNWGNGKDGDSNRCRHNCGPTVGVPEPGTLGLMGVGLLAAGIIARRRK